MKGSGALIVGFDAFQGKEARELYEKLVTKKEATNA